jgi:hypothetical protein
MQKHLHSFQEVTAVSWMKDQLPDANRPEYTVPTLIFACCHKEDQCEALHVFAKQCTTLFMLWEPKVSEGRCKRVPYSDNMTICDKVWQLGKESSLLLHPPPTIPAATATPKIWTCFSWKSHKKRQTHGRKGLLKCVRGSNSEQTVMKILKIHGQ